METIALLKTVLSLAIVLGALLFTIWAMKVCQNKFQCCKFIKNINNKQRIKILEQRKIDIKNSVVLLSVDNVEHTVLPSSGQAHILNSSKGKKND
jgi:flagellar biogenesis protein FliO